VPKTHSTFEIGEVNNDAREVGWVKRHVLSYNRNGRWGTCSVCPGTFAKIEPEICVFTTRSDHKLDAKGLIKQALLRGVRLIESSPTPKEKTLTIVSGDDWSGAYIDGVLTHEGHSINIHDWLELVTMGITKTERLECDDAWLYKLGRFPKLLQDVKQLGD
jgi:hypothetical protein